jgi:hypothetical protein
MLLIFVTNYNFIHNISPSNRYSLNFTFLLMNKTQARLYISTQRSKGFLLIKYLFLSFRICLYKAQDDVIVLLLKFNSQNHFTY